MTVPMKPVERIQAALDHRPPDRIPAYFGGTSTNLTDTAYFKALTYWNLGDPVDPYRFGHTGCYVDNRILEVCIPGVPAPGAPRSGIPA